MKVIETNDLEIDELHIDHTNLIEMVEKVSQEFDQLLDKRSELEESIAQNRIKCEILTTEISNMKKEIKEEISNIGANNSPKLEELFRSSKQKSEEHNRITQLIQVELDLKMKIIKDLLPDSHEQHKILLNLHQETNDTVTQKVSENRKLLRN
jgi:ABC-type transporter Mla subunit MlaD